jgi:ferredoxin-thioredoxin reductase catalytic subunit
MFQLNPDKRTVEAIRRALRNNNGYCPCRPEKTDDTSCPCVMFVESGECCCNLFQMTGGDT